MGRVFSPFSFFPGYRANILLFFSTGYINICCREYFELKVATNGALLLHFFGNYEFLKLSANQHLQTGINRYVLRLAHFVWKVLDLDDIKKLKQIWQICSWTQLLPKLMWSPHKTLVCERAEKTTGRKQERTHVTVKYGSSGPQFNFTPRKSNKVILCVS